jgi:signal transduction histidine kinase
VLVLDPLPAHGPFTPPFSSATILALLAIAVLVSGTVSYAFARSISRPLERLQGAARRYAAGDLGARADARDASRSDEIGGLAREFDAMTARLEALIEARKQLLRDMSHELRSPLARLQMAVGIARQPNADTGRQLERIERESERLESLIARILEFARLERDPSTLTREDLDVVELARRVVHDAEFEAQAPAGRITLDVAAEADAGWARIPHADPAVLHTALDNVVRNALLHGGGGPIEVSIAATRDEVAVTVRDHGPGVPPRDLERIFEPFYRVVVDVPRAEGHGVGLALARQAVALHGGSVTAENAEGGGLRVRIVLPYPRIGIGSR